MSGVIHQSQWRAHERLYFLFPLTLSLKMEAVNYTDSWQHSPKPHGVQFPEQDKQRYSIAVQPSNRIPLFPSWPAASSH